MKASDVYFKVVLCGGHAELVVEGCVLPVVLASDAAFLRAVVVDVAHLDNELAWFVLEGI